MIPALNNDILIELIFKRGTRPTLEKVQKDLFISTSLAPNYTLISERGVKIFKRPEQIIELFTAQRLGVVKRRYQLRCAEMEEKIRRNNEIIKFIKQREFVVATRQSSRKSFVEYLKGKKFFYADYLADMPIYRMTKEEVAKRVLALKQDKLSLKEYRRIANSPRLVKKKLIEELEEVSATLTAWQAQQEKNKKALYKKPSSTKRRKR